MNKLFLSATTKGIDSANRTLTAYGNRPIIDRDEELIEAGAWDLEEYKQNAVLLVGHDYKSLPVGKVIDIRDTAEGLLFKAQFAQTGTANEVWQLYSEGFLKSFSVGFLPLEWIDGKSQGEPRRTYTKAKLLEISCVSVPSNPAATVLMALKAMAQDDVIFEIEL